jgi:hypothetical protein
MVLVLLVTLSVPFGVAAFVPSIPARGGHAPP